MQQKSGVSRKEKAVQTKNKIYESAEYLFSKYGCETVNVDDIVKHAGVAKGSFYVHFESKDALIAVLIRDYVKKIDMDYKTYIETIPPDITANVVIISIVEKIADVITDKIGYDNMKNLYRIQMVKNEDPRAAISYNRDIYMLFSNVISKGIEERIFRPELSTDETARQLIVAYRGLVYEWIVRYPEFDLKAEALKLFNLLLTGIVI